MIRDLSTLKGGKKNPWKFLVLAVPLPLLWNAWEQGARTPPWLLRVLSEAPGLNCLCVHCFNEKQSPNLTLSKSQITHDLFPTVWKENIYEQPQVCKGDWYDKNGIEAKGCVPCMTDFFKKSLREWFVWEYFLKNDALVPAFLHLRQRYLNISLLFEHYWLCLRPAIF